MTLEESIIVLSPFETNIFLEYGGNPSIVFGTNNLWKKPSSQLVQQLGSTEAEEALNKCATAIYSIPSDTNNLSVSVKKNHIIVTGVTGSTDYDPIVTSTFHVPLPVDTEFDNILNNYKDIFDEICKEFNIDIVVMKQSGIKNGLLFYLYGTATNVAKAQQQALATADLVRHHDNVILDYVDLDSISLLPYFMDPSNLHFLKSHHKTNCFVPQVLSLNTEANPQLILTSKIYSNLLRTKYLLQEKCNLMKDSLYYKKISNVPIGKIAFLKKFFGTQINQFMIENQTFIRLEKNFIEFQSSFLHLLDLSIKNFTLFFLQNVIELTIFTDKKSDLQNNILQNFRESEFLLIHSSAIEDKIFLITTYSNLLSRCKAVFDKENESIEQLKVNFEIHLDYEDFISGKKNGKLTRIIETSNSIIELSNSNDTLMTISLINETFEDFSISLKKLIDELPAEVSFFIAEVYHRPIIGTGGSIIQTIMRKNNVFIQFSNSYSLPQDKLYLERYDNVIIRCPNKNKGNIKFAKEELLKLVENFQFLQNSSKLALTSNKFNNIILNNGNLMNLIQLEKKFNVFIKFPKTFHSDRENIMQINGNDNNVINMVTNTILQDEKLWIREVSLKLSSNFKKFIEADSNLILFYNEVINPLETAFNGSFVTLDKLQSMITVSYIDDEILDEKIVKLIGSYLNNNGITVSR
ncbi:hypothetical protein KAFR_0L00290 [Kazachstania africana CBS 2517]|uniref:K Homology domain-containing protein n=1 Tax=Kazachstania africana (strain ATCC 22294 / BCRC 22015 / CBS 2517 / CECT 1963 / NBRC 1671 / NRRL Y-8276) TaxID=1071382 RepID=H2B1Y6_KAZAF|nr:hypothetical protein KAFR_0L00290 [Kazachstania africana CBS 2517]CCF60636.1 hypothetical protein KAFR_0L00290 [Kazachstania africana CBS 2517]